MQTRRAHDAPLGTSAALAFVTLDYIRRKTMQNRKATGVEWFIKLLF
jgi:hypothetical protein